MDVFAVIVKAEIYLQAENKRDAEMLAEKMTEEASWHMPGDTILDCRAYRTPNQSDDMRKLALNKAPNVEVSGCLPKDKQGNAC